MRRTVVCYREHLQKADDHGWEHDRDTLVCERNARSGDAQDGRHHGNLHHPEAREDVLEGLPFAVQRDH